MFCRLHVWNQGKLCGGFRRRKLTRIDQFSNNFRVAIATGLFILLAWCLFRTGGYFWNEAPGLWGQKSRHALLRISLYGTALVRHIRQHGARMAVNRSHKNWWYDVKCTWTKVKSCPMHTSCAICSLCAHKLYYMFALCTWDEILNIYNFLICNLVFINMFNTTFHVKVHNNQVVCTWYNNKSVIVPQNF